MKAETETRVLNWRRKEESREEKAQERSWREQRVRGRGPRTGEEGDRRRADALLAAGSLRGTRAVTSTDL